jgi:hypothetical protein
MDNNIVTTISKNLHYDAYNDIQLLNRINMKRKYKEYNNFANIGYILVTGNKKIIKVAWHKLIKKEGNVPLATNLDWLTNKFWFKLNKGFGDNNTPINTNIIFKSKIILSSFIGDKIGIEYDIMMKEVKNGNLNEEQAQNRLRQLKEYTPKPEEIKNDELNNIISFLSEDSLEKSKDELDHMKQEFNEINASNNELKLQLEEYLKENIKDKTAILTNKEKQKNILDNKHKKMLNFTKYLIFIERFIIPPFLAFIIFFILLKIYTLFNKQQIDIVFYLIPIISIIFPTLITIVFNKMINVLPLVKIFYDITEKFCMKLFKFDFNEYFQLQNEISEIKQTVTEYNKTLNDKKIVDNHEAEK